jgi:hypothetical protein
MRWEEAYEGWQVKRLSQEDAAKLLGVCDRTFRRYIDRYEEAGEYYGDSLLNTPIMKGCLVAPLPPLIIPGYPHHVTLRAHAKRLEVLILGYPHPVTQSGTPRVQTFFKDGDYELYIALLSETARKDEAKVWELSVLSKLSP